MCLLCWLQVLEGAAVVMDLSEAVSALPAVYPRGKSRCLSASNAPALSCLGLFRLSAQGTGGTKQRDSNLVNPDTCSIHAFELCL